MRRHGKKRHFGERPKVFDDGWTTSAQQRWENSWCGWPKVGREKKVSTGIRVRRESLSLLQYFTPCAESLKGG